MYTAPNLLTLAALLSLGSALVLLLLGSRLGRGAAFVSTGSIVAALGLSLATLIVWVARPQFNQAHYAEAMTCRWLPVTDPPQTRLPTGLNFMEARGVAREMGRENARRAHGLEVGVLVDSLTIAMFLTISMIAALVHIFSIVSMGSDPRYHRFLACLDLLCFAMFALALSNNLLQMLAFLQLLALCAWFLIGFSRQRRNPVRAASLGFMIQCVGTAAFLIGTGTLVAQSSIGLSGLTFYAQGPDMVGTPVLEHQVLVAIAGAGAMPSDVLYLSAAPLLLGLSWLTWAGICIFVGAMAMSAQFPLHVWLADAAEGPTPALAMLGSIASVAAGAFVVARLYGILTLDARLFIATIGCISLAGGALLAAATTNIKRILAFSSVSHLGLVMLFFGAGAYVAALFVLVVHAFCKACLFLAAGSVLHSCRGEPQLRRLGGLWKRLPITAGTALLALLSLCGLPWLSGFFGQGMGMAVVQQYAAALPSRYGMLLWWIPSLALAVTAFYLWRWWWLIFGGKPRDPELFEGAHENALMTLVLILLAGLTVVATYLDIDHIVAKSAPAAAMVVAAGHPDPLEAIGRVTGWAPVLTGVAVMLIYMQGFGVADWIRRLPGCNLVYLWLRENMFLEYLYDGIIARGFRLLGAGCALIDRCLIDHLLALVARAARILARAAGNIDACIVDFPARMLVAAIRFVQRRFRRNPAASVTETL